MKPQGAELVTEISKLQWMVSELKTGLTGALLELAHVQHGDSDLREELDHNRRRCREKARRLETLLESLREELAGLRGHVLTLHQQQDAENTLTTRGETDSAEACRGKVLLHCFLQGLKAGLAEGTDARQQVALQLLHSEWEYVSTLEQLYDKYQHVTTPPYEKFAWLVERLLQRHLLFRDTLQERLAAHRWKSLVGDVLVRLVGQNETSFSDAYVAYVSTLASFVSHELRRLDTRDHKQGSWQAETEQSQVLSLLLAPVTRVHAYLTHIQNLLQWTGKEHPDRSLLLGTERTLRDLLWRCHAILEEDVRWDAPEPPSRSSANSAPHRIKEERAALGDSQQASGLTNGPGAEQHSMRLECWSCSPVRRHTCRCCPAAPEPAGHRAENGLSGRRSDPDDTSASATSRRETEGEEEEEEEEDSQVPVLLKPSSQQRSERSVCVRWQIPRRTPRTPVGPPAPAGSCGKRLVTVRTGSPPLRAKSAFRPIWDDPTKQAQASPKKEHRGFVPVQNSARENVLTSGEPLRGGRGLLQPQPGGRLWEDSEDSEGPCSTV